MEGCGNGANRWVCAECHTIFRRRSDLRQHNKLCSFKPPQPLLLTRPSVTSAPQTTRGRGAISSSRAIEQRPGSLPDSSAHFRGGAPVNPPPEPRKLARSYSPRSPLPAWELSRAKINKDLEALHAQFPTAALGGARTGVARATRSHDRSRSAELAALRSPQQSARRAPPGGASSLLRLPTSPMPHSPLLQRHNAEKLACIAAASSFASYPHGDMRRPRASAVSPHPERMPTLALPSVSPLSSSMVGAIPPRLLSRPWAPSPPPYRPLRMTTDGQCVELDEDEQVCPRCHIDLLTPSGLQVHCSIDHGVGVAVVPKGSVLTTQADAARYQSPHLRPVDSPAFSFSDSEPAREDLCVNCETCGGFSNVIPCSTEGCNKASHARCAHLRTPETPWFCRSCHLRRSIRAVSLVPSPAAAARALPRGLMALAGNRQSRGLAAAAPVDLSPLSLGGARAPAPNLLWGAHRPRAQQQPQQEPPARPAVQLRQQQQQHATEKSPPGPSQVYG